MNLQKQRRQYLILTAVCLILFIAGAVIAVIVGFDSTPLVEYIVYALFIAGAVGGIMAAGKVETITKQMYPRALVTHYVHPVCDIKDHSKRATLGAISWEELAILLQKSDNVPSKAKICRIETHDVGIILIVEM